MSLRHRCEYAADLPHSLPGSERRPPQEFPDPPHTQGNRVRATSGPDPPGSSRWNDKRRNNAGSSRTPLHHARRTRAIWQYWHVPSLSGLLTALPGTTRVRLPSASLPCCDKTVVQVFHLHSNQQRLMAHSPAVPSPMAQPFTPPLLRCCIERHHVPFNIASLHLSAA
jgi:hypothetical protein